MRRTWLHVARTGAVMLAAVLVIVASAAAASETRVALVIGNSAYSHTVPPPHPPNDAADVAAALDRLGFDVVRANDLTYKGLRRTLLAF